MSKTLKEINYIKSQSGDELAENYLNGNKTFIKFLKENELKIPKEALNPLELNLDKEQVYETLLEFSKKLVKEIEDGIYHEDNDWNRYSYETLFSTLYSNFFEWKGQFE